MFPVLQIGPLAVQVPGLLLLAGLWIGLTLAERRAPVHGIRPESLYNLVFYSLIAGVVGARLAYAARFPGAFLQSPLSLLSLQPGLFDPAGGIALGGITAFIYTQRKRLPGLKVLDAAAPLLAVMLIAVPLANLSSGNGYGTETGLPWSIDIWGATRHPTQVYEALAGGVILAWLLRGSRRNTSTPAPGGIFFSTVVLAAVSRVALEAFRADSTLIAGGLRVEQIAAWLIAAAGLYALRRLPADSDAG